MTDQLAVTPQPRLAPLSVYPWMMQDALPSRRPVMKEIAALVAERYGLTVEDLRSPARCRRVAVPRQEAMWLMRKTNWLSYPQIGAFFNRDHTTALHGCRAHEKRIKP